MVMIISNNNEEKKKSIEVNRNKIEHSQNIKNIRNYNTRKHAMESSHK